MMEYTLKQFYLETVPHTDTHTDENKTQVFYWTLAARERDELGVAVHLGSCTLVGGGAPWCGTCQ